MITAQLDLTLEAANQAPTRPQPHTSIIIVNYNGGALLLDCVSAALAANPDAELILVDNASTDGSAYAVEHHFPDVRCVYSKQNVGFGEGNNIGARHAQGKYLVFLNPDTIVEQGWLEPLIDTLEKNKTVGLATPKIVLLDQPEVVNACGNTIHCTGLTLCRGAGTVAAMHMATTEVGAVSGAAFVIRRTLFDELGGFDGCFFLYVEDTDLSWRARLAGYRILCVPSSVVHHDYTLRFGPRKSYYQERNRYMMLLKGLQWRTLCVLLPVLLGGEIVTWGFVLLREPHRIGNKLQAYIDTVTNWNAIMSERRRVQSLRRVRDHDIIEQLDYRLAYEQTGKTIATSAAHLLFDPFFFVLHKLTTRIVSW